MRAVKIDELPAYVLDRLAGKLPTCVRPTSTNPADEDAAGNLPMCGQRAAYVAVTDTGDVTGVTWCAGCVDRDRARDQSDRFGRPGWHPLNVDDVEAFVADLAAPADPLADVTVERDRLARDVEALTAERDALTRLLIAAGRDRDTQRARADLTRDELTRTTVERDDARRQRDALTDQLDAALDDRDRARAELRDARAELRTEIETHRVTCDRLADVDHHADGLRMALAAMLDAPADPGPAALALIGRLGPGGRWTGAALAAHSAGHYGKAIRLAARGILHRHDDGDATETLGEVAADLLDDSRDRTAAAWAATVPGSPAPATLSTGSGTARA